MTKRILIVDDDELVLIALRELLKPHGYEVHSFTSGLEALKSLDNMSFDIMMFDIMMPEIDGFELCTRVREKEAHRETPIVFLTAKSRDEDRNRGLAVGANLFLSKPISPERLLKLISDTIG